MASRIYLMLMDPKGGDMKTMKLLSAFVVSAVIMLAVGSAAAVGTITFENRTGRDITAQIEYHDMAKFVCPSHSLEIKAHGQQSLQRDWTSLKGYCPIGQILLSFDGVPAARIGTSALPLLAKPLHVVLSIVDGGLHWSKIENNASK